ncbi:hypothetical protein [uncultured Clostridium sp.]|uniref:hypothetical protein n=1 Tax=uncultured Clostridium sp. TaxID=59620 RepID=UPI00321742C0
MNILWNKINEKLPKDNQKILVWYENSIQTVYFYKGVWNEKCVKYNRYCGADQQGNNTLPYNFSVCHSPMTLFGQEILYWAEIPELEFKEDVTDIGNYVLNNNEWSEDEFTHEKVYTKELEVKKEDVVEPIKDVTKEEMEEIISTIKSQYDDFLKMIFGKHLNLEELRNDNTRVN